MARIAGVDLPKKKKIEYALPYIYGIGLTLSRKVLKDTGIDPNKRVYELTEEEVSVLNKEIQNNYVVEGELRKIVQLNIKELMDLGCYRGLRHRKGLPVRGQRTRTNARTRKGKKKTVGSKAK